MIDFQKLPSPCFVLDEQLLDRNLAVIDRVRRESGAEVIVALKACAMWSIFPELAQHSDGATASSLAEARLVFEEFGRPAHTYAPVYTDRNIEEILDCSDHITFNSVAQFERFGQMALLRGISCGLRINPGYSPVETDLYNPCVPGSRLGIPAGELKELPAGVEGLHFHVLCESRPEHLRLALDAVEERFGRFLDRIKWLNMGGGHLMTHKDYDCDELIRILQEFKAKYPNLRLILEPGSATFTTISGLKARNNSHKSATLSASTCAVFTRSPPIAAAMASHFAFVRLASITSEKIGLAAIFCATTVPTPPAPIIRALHIKFILF